MRLYLSSFLFGSQPNWLKSFAAGRKRVGLILNALDHRDDSRDRFLLSQTTGLQDLGFCVVEVDLRRYFGRPEALAATLSSLELLWVNGGNTFILRRAMHQSGFDEVALPLIRKESLFYGGFSAGCAVLHEDLRGIEFSDDPNLVPPGYKEEPIWEGLGLIDFSIAVHYQSDHPEADQTEREIQFYQATGRPYKPLRDGEVLTIHNANVEKLSESVQHVR